VAEPITPAQLAEDLGQLQADDVRAYICDVLGLDLHDDEIPAEIAADVYRAFDPHGDRTAPARLCWPGHDEDPRPPSPTGEEGFYPDTQHAETP
jgi:hypothetical protein